jgi:hypothetical protein
LLRLAWAAPCSLIGLCCGAVALLLGGRVGVVAGALEFSLPEDRRLGRAIAARLPFGAITFGHVVFGIDPGQLALLRAHERVHVRQYEILGPLFLLAYPLASLVAAARGRPPYRANWFEVQARRETAAQRSLEL